MSLITNIVEFQQKVFNLPRDIQFILREYGVIKHNDHLLCIGKLDNKNEQIKQNIIKKSRKIVLDWSIFARPYSILYEPVTISFVKNRMPPPRMNLQYDITKKIKSNFIGDELTMYLNKNIPNISINNINSFIETKNSKKSKYNKRWFYGK